MGKLLFIIIFLKDYFKLNRFKKFLIKIVNYISRTKYTYSIFC